MLFSLLLFQMSHIALDLVARVLGNSARRKGQVH